MVSAAGSVIVGMAYSSFWQAFRSTAASGMIGLGAGGNAFRVSPDGTIIVGSTGVDGGEAYRWTAAGGFVGLGIPPQGVYSFACDLSADGSVIVGGTGVGAFLRTAA